MIDKYPQRMKVLSKHYQELSMLLFQLLLMTHGVNSASQPCLSTPCFFPLTEIQNIDQPTSNDETLTAWDDHQLETNELPPSENDEGYFYDFPTGMPDESKAQQETKQRYEEYGRDMEDFQRGESVIPRQPLVLFILRAPFQRPSQNGCTRRNKNKDARCLQRHKVDNTQVYAPLMKRGRINGLQKWTSAGLPFSVLYHHHKQVSRSKSASASNGMRAGNAQAAAQRSPDSGQWISQAGPVVTTRKQYSTLPHLFVSYGWGPLGK